MATVSGQDKLKEEQLNGAAAIADQGISNVIGGGGVGTRSPAQSQAAIGNLSGGRVPFAGISSYLKGSNAPAAQNTASLMAAPAEKMLGEQSKITNDLAMSKLQLSKDKDTAARGMEAYNSIVRGRQKDLNTRPAGMRPPPRNIRASGLTTEEIMTGPLIANQNTIDNERRLADFNAMTAIDLNQKPQEAVMSDYAKEFKDYSKTYQDKLNQQFAKEQTGSGTGYYSRGENLLDKVYAIQNPGIKKAADVVQNRFQSLTDYINNVNNVESPAITQAYQEIGKYKDLPEYNYAKWLSDAVRGATPVQRDPAAQQVNLINKQFIPNQYK